MRRQPSIPLMGLTTGILLLALGTPLAIELEKTPMSWNEAAPTDGDTLYANLCASCHGADAKGAGPAAPALATPAPDLTVLSANNGGVFPESDTRRTIAGRSDRAAHEAGVMPAWAPTFEAVRPDWKPARRRAFARERIDALVLHLEGVQAATPESDEG